MSSALICVAIVAYLEARGEGPDGMLAVADVIMERTHDPRWSTDPCVVAKQKDQFAYLPLAQVIPIIENEHDASWLMAIDSAKEVLAGGGFHMGATHFHSGKETPYWTKGATLVGRWGDHLFWRVEK